MDKPNLPRDSIPSEALGAKTLAWLELKQEMAGLHAQVEYVALLLRMGVGKLDGVQ